MRIVFKILFNFLLAILELGLEYCNLVLNRLLVFGEVVFHHGFHVFKSLGNAYIELRTDCWITMSCWTLDWSILVLRSLIAFV